MEPLVRLKLVPTPQGGLLTYVLYDNEPSTDCYSWLLPQAELHRVCERQNTVHGLLAEHCNELVAFNQAAEAKFVRVQQKFKDSYPKIRQMREDLNVIYKTLLRLKRKQAS